MTATTTQTLTTQQIQTLRNEAAVAGDSEMVRICDAAIRGDRPARGQVVKAINAAEAMEAETVESVDGNEYTLDAWLRAVGSWQAQDPSMLRQAWRAGEDPADYVAAK